MNSILLVVPEQIQQTATVERWGMANWSAAFAAVLEKRGWLSIDVRSLAELKGVADVSRYDLVIVAWHGDGGPTEEQARWLQAAGRPVLIEGPANPELLNRFGVPAAGDAVRLPGSPALDLIDADIRSELGRRSPALLGPDPKQLVLEDKAVVMREMEFDFIGARHKAMQASDPAEAAASMLISILQVFKRRFERHGHLFEDIALDLSMAHSLQLIQAKLGDGRHADLARAFITRAVQAALARLAARSLTAAERTRLEPLRARLEGDDPVLPEDEQAKLKAERLVSAVERSPDLSHDDRLAQVFPRINIPNLLLAVANMPVGSEAARNSVFLDLRDRFYSPQAGGFRAGGIRDGKFFVEDGIVSHPHVAQALARISGPIEMPHFGTLSRTGFTPRQRDVWDRAPLLHQRLDAGGWDVVAAFAASAEPAVLQRGHCTLTSFPLLSWITHYHTMGPLPEAYDVASSAGFMGAEELLVLCLERLMRQSPRPVPRLAPWPWGFDYALNIRHDVDRIPDPAAFERLMQFHRDQALGVTWCWLPWRLDRDKMLAQHAAGHEVALHSVRSLEKAEECRAIARETGVEVVGEAYHGTAADYWLGAPSVAASIRANLSYSEFAPNMFLFPYAAYPWLEADGSVTLRRGCMGITQSGTTDNLSATGDRKGGLISKLAYMKEWASRGLAVVLLNHPDINFDRLQMTVGELPAKGRLNWTGRQIADWRRRTHQLGQLTWKWEGDALVLTAVEDVVDLALILPATGRQIEVDGKLASDAMLDHGREGEIRLRLSLKAQTPARVRWRDTDVAPGRSQQGLCTVWAALPDR